MNRYTEFEALSDDEVMNLLAEMIDRAGDTRDVELASLALDLSEKLTERETLSGEKRVLLHYFRANAFENQLDLAGQRRTGAWDIPHLQDVLLELRRAVRHVDWPHLDPFRRCQIYTNLGNKLNSLGRPVEALAYWDRAVALNPNFAMALANRGHGLRHYGQALSDNGHRGLFLLAAHDSLSEALVPTAVFDSAENLSLKPAFAAAAEQLATSIDLAAARSDLYQTFRLGKSRAEHAYRSWCLENRLFLNPLNDLGAFSIAARDVLHLPSLTVGFEEGGPEPPVAFGFYNQMKQEFVSARWIYYEGITRNETHFSDNDTHLYDTLNVPSYSLNTEKRKMAFRMAYSLFDKIAFFINDYFKAGLPERHISFRNVWYQNSRCEKSLNSIFENRRNWPLRGLFWLSRDLYEPSFQQVSEPDADELAHLRNHLEHKYCQVNINLGITYLRFTSSRNDSSLGLRIDRDMLEEKGLHILKLARSALIYLSLAVHQEETDRNSARKASLVGSMPLSVWEDRGKL